MLREKGGKAGRRKTRGVRVSESDHPEAQERSRRCFSGYGWLAVFVERGGGGQGCVGKVSGRGGGGSGLGMRLHEVFGGVPLRRLRWRGDGRRGYAGSAGGMREWGE